MLLLAASASAQLCTWGGTSATPAPTASHLRAQSEFLQAPGRVAIDPSDHLFITDPASGRVIERSALGRLLAVEEGFQGPMAIAIDALGRRYLGEQETGRVAVYDADWNLLFELGDGDGEFGNPVDIALDPSDGSIYVADGANHTIEVYDSAGSWLRTLGGQGGGAGQFDFPGAVLVSSAGEVWVADQNNDRVQVLDTDGVLQRCFGYQDGESRKFGRIQDLIEDSAGRFYAADSFHGHVTVLDSAGVELTSLSGFGAGEGELYTPAGLALDSSNRLFVASHNNSRVEVFGIDTYSDPYDGSPAGTVQFELATYQGSEDSGSVAVLVTREGGTSGLIRVDYSTVNGNATAGFDYLATTGSLTFPDGESTAQVFEVPLLDDPTYEGDESLTLALAAPVGGELGAQSSAVLSILENEPNSPGTVQFESATYGGPEGGAPVTVTVTRTDGAVGTVEVTYGVSGGTATAGLDYSVTGATISFTHEDSASKSFQLTIVDDPLYEGDEQVTLALSQPTGGATIGSPAGATVTLLDDEVPCPPTLDLVGHDVMVPELYVAAQSISAGDALAMFRVISPAGDATLRAGETIVLNDGFEVESGAALTLEIDPGVCGGGP